MSKLIQKEIKHAQQADHTAEIETILEKFRGFGRITNLKRRGKKGESQHDRQSNADVCATSYEDFYNSKFHTASQHAPTFCGTMPVLHMEELMEEVEKLQRENTQTPPAFCLRWSSAAEKCWHEPCLTCTT